MTLDETAVDLVRLLVFKQQLVNPAQHDDRVAPGGIAGDRPGQERQNLLLTRLPLFLPQDEPGLLELPPDATTSLHSADLVYRRLRLLFVLVDLLLTQQAQSCLHVGGPILGNLTQHGDAGGFVVGHQAEYGQGNPGLDRLIALEYRRSLFQRLAGALTSPPFDCNVASTFLGTASEGFF